MLPSIDYTLVQDALFSIENFAWFNLPNLKYSLDAVNAHMCKSKLLLDLASV